MKTGLLWFDNDPRKTLEEKVQRAAAHYEHKYGHMPNMCFVHPNAYGDNKQLSRKSGDVEIRTGRSVLLNHYWLGMTQGTNKQEINK